MTARAIPTKLIHFTHFSNIPSIIQNGLLSDSVTRAKGALSVEAGNLEIKANRRSRLVPLHPGGVVADYVPFYFGPRSPMMYAIAKGNVPTYPAKPQELVHLVTSLEKLTALGYEPLIITDRNAAVAYADFRHFALPDTLADAFIDWDIINSRYWNDFLDGRERRMAECLVHKRVGWEAIDEIVVADHFIARTVNAVLANTHFSGSVQIKTDWYF